MTARVAAPDAKVAARIQSLITSLDHEGEVIPRRAVKALARYGAVAVPALRAELRSSRSVRRRRWAAHALGYIPVRSATREIERALGDPNMSVRLHAVTSVVRIGTPALARRLIPLTNDPSGGVRVNVLDALARMQVPGAAPAILRALRDPKWYVRLAALRAAESLRVDVPRRLLERLERDPRPGVRRAARAIGRTQRVS